MDISSAPLSRVIDIRYKRIESYNEQMREARSYLAANGAEAFQRAAVRRGSERWGIGAKRVRVTFPQRPRPILIGQGSDDRNLAEVVNQCATMERRLERLLEPAWKNRARLRPAHAEARREQCPLRLDSLRQMTCHSTQERTTWHNASSAVTTLPSRD